MHKQTAMSAAENAARLTELRTLAEAAVRGPWRVGGNVVTDEFDVLSMKNTTTFDQFICRTRTTKNSDYIAAVSPDVVLGLLDELEALRAALGGLAGTDPDGMDGMHFVGDEDNPGDCPGCVARAALDAWRAVRGEAAA